MSSAVTCEMQGEGLAMPENNFAGNAERFDLLMEMAPNQVLMNAAALDKRIEAQDNSFDDLSLSESNLSENSEYMTD